MNLANYFDLRKHLSCFLLLAIVLLSAGCVSTSKHISSGFAGDQFEDRIDQLVDELLQHQKNSVQAAPAAVMPGSLRSGQKYTRLEELIMDRLNLKLRQKHEIYQLTTQNWFEFREGRPLTFQNKPLSERDSLQKLTIYEVSLSPEEALGKLRSRITAFNIYGRTLPGVIADMEFDLKPSSPANKLYSRAPNNALFPEGLEERPYTSLDRMAFSLTATLTDAYNAGIKVAGKQAAGSEVQVMLYVKPGVGVSPEMARTVQEAIQQAMVSSPGFTCILSREDFGPALGQIDFYKKNMAMFDMEDAKFKAGTVLLMADISKHKDPGKTGVALRAIWRVSPLESETGDLIPTNVSGTYLSGFTAKAYLLTDNRDYSAHEQNQAFKAESPSYNALPNKGFE